MDPPDTPWQGAGAPPTSTLHQETPTLSLKMWGVVFTVIWLQ